MGPTKIITEKFVCDGCHALKTERWEFYGENDDRDSGTDAKCSAADRHIDSYWHKSTKTPDWCPFPSDKTAVEGAR